MINQERKKSEFTEIFEQFLRTYPVFKDLSEIARRNSYDMGRQSRIWIIGGFVYRPIIRALYGDIPEPSQADVDLLISRGPASEEIYAPEGWTIHKTQTGFLYLEKEDTRLDLNYLFNFHSISSVARAAKGKGMPKFKYFFKGTPMDIQSIAYDLTDKNVGVIGKHGIEAIKRKIVKVNSLDEARFEAKKRKIGLEDLVSQKAKELHFKYDLKPIYPSRILGESNGKNSTLVKE